MTQDYTVQTDNISTLIKHVIAYNKTVTNMVVDIDSMEFTVCSVFSEKEEGILGLTRL